MPGFLASDPAAEPFFVSRGYQLNQTCQVFQCKLEKPISMADGRYSALRNRFELSIAPRKTTGTFWYEATQGLIEPFDFRLEDKRTKETVGQTTVWEMENFSWRWNQPAVGLTDILVRPELRRQGIGKFLLSQILRYLQEQFFALVEVQTVSENEPAIKLYQNIGFEQVDTGHTFRRVVSPS